MTVPADSAIRRPLCRGFMPPLFVLPWAGGCVVTKLGVAFAEPFTFPFCRFAVATVLLLGWLMFGEMLGPLALLGMAAAVAGVALVMRK